MAFRLSRGLPACSRPYSTFSTRSCSLSFDTTLRRARLPSVQRREFHSSLPAMKKKQKGKAHTEDQDGEFGFDDQGGGDLFGELAAEAIKTTEAVPPILPTPKEVEKANLPPTAVAHSPEKKDKFEELFSRLENRAGKPPAPPKKFMKAIRPPEFGLIASLLALVQTPGDYKRFTQILAQWRQYPRKLGSRFQEHVISRGINVGAAPQALDILLHQPKFGISLRRAMVARQLMHAICDPAPSPLIPPEEQRHIPYVERIEQALQLATLLPHAYLVPLTRDLTSSALILSLMCQASYPPLIKQSSESSSGTDKPAWAQPPQTDQESTNQWKAPIQELLSSLRLSQESNAIAFPHHRRERMWTLNSLRLAVPLLREWNMKDLKWVEGKVMKLERSQAAPRKSLEPAVAE